MLEGYIASLRSTLHEASDGLRVELRSALSVFVFHLTGDQGADTEAHTLIAATRRECYCMTQVCVFQGSADSRVICVCTIETGSVGAVDRQ